MSGNSTPRDRSAERRATALMRAAVLAWYSPAWPPACACCGATEQLGIEHVNGDGKAQREALFGVNSVSGRFYRYLIENRFPDDPPLQVHCLPCNSSKGDGAACRLDHSLSREEQRRGANQQAQAAWRARHGVSVSIPAGLDADVLRYLGEHGPSRSGVIARDVGSRPTIMSACLAVLSKAGNIENPAYGVYRLPGQEDQPLPGVGYGSRSARRRTIGSPGADAQAAWRERHGTSRHVSTNPGTAGGKIIEYLRGHGPSHVDAITAGTGLTNWSVATNVAGLLKKGHIERHIRMDGEFRREVRGTYRLPESGVTGEATEAH
jgi:hypothetical protein